MPFKHTFLWILTTYPLFLVWVSTLLFIFSCSWSVKFLCKHSSNNTKEKLSDYTWKYETALVVQLQKDSFKTLVKLICSFMRECCWDKEWFGVRHVYQTVLLNPLKYPLAAILFGMKVQHSSPNITHTLLSCRSFFPCHATSSYIHLISCGFRSTVESATLYWT